MGSAWPRHGQGTETRDMVCVVGLQMATTALWQPYLSLYLMLLPQGLCAWELQNIICSVNRGWICFSIQGPRPQSQALPSWASQMHTIVCMAVLPLLPHLPCWPPCFWAPATVSLCLHS